MIPRTRFALRLALAAACVAALCAPAGRAAAGETPASAQAVAAHREFGPLRLRDLRGDPVSLDRLRGSVVVLNFWATWCRPCIEETPLLADLAKRWRARGLVVVMASVDEEESRDQVAAFASALPKGVEVWLGATLDDMKRLRLGSSIPATVVLDREGGAVQTHLGPLAKGSLDATIDELLDEEPAAPRSGGLTEAAATAPDDEVQPALRAAHALPSPAVGSLAGADAARQAAGRSL